MLRQQILEALSQSPFSPFRIVLTTGTTYTIRHPDQAWVGPGYVVIGISPTPMPSHEVINATFVSIVHIAELQPIEQPVVAESN